MSTGNRKYSDPTDVMRRVTNNNGVMIKIGNEEDIGDYNHNFSMRIQEGQNFKLIMDYILKKKQENDDKKKN